MLRRRPLSRFWPLAFFAEAACSRAKEPPRDAGPPAAEIDDAFVWPIAPVDLNPAPPPRKGMVFVPTGSLVAGTEKDKTPRLAEQELAGDRIEMRGFYIDEYAYPNEAGAIPKTGMSRDEAAALCATQGKRLCTELEWERACKGPNNTTYEYGDQYRPTECATGVTARLAPSAMRVSCKSAFGVHDMHGGPWEWTSSTWHRGYDPAVGVVRGGNGEAGELVSRCANGMPLVPRLRRPDIGARCCAGDPNEAEVRVAAPRLKPLEARPSEAKLTAKLAGAIQEKTVELPREPAFHIDRVLAWHPVSNEEFALGVGCVRRSPHASCGVGVFRTQDGEVDPTLLAFASSGFWNAVVKPDQRGHDLWVYGGDERTNYKRRVAYIWGRVAVGDLERPGRHAVAP